jgi:hypothetical protein
MPDRILPDKIWEWRRFERLPLDIQNFYLRLMSTVDDHGRRLAEVSVLRAQVFPLRPQIRNADIARWLKALEAADLVGLWEDGEMGPMLQVVFFRRHGKQANRSKYGDPPREVAGRLEAVQLELPGTIVVATAQARAAPVRASASTNANARAEWGAREGEAFAETPSLDEVLAYAQVIGLAPWAATEWWNYMESLGWMSRGTRLANWRPALVNKKTRWEADGRPMEPKGSYGNNAKASTPGNARREGDYLSGLAEKYRQKFG